MGPAALLVFSLLASDVFADQPDGTRIHYLSEGEGPAAIIQIHGWACNATFWRMQSPAFAKERYRVISIDLPGHGQSSAPPGVDYTIEHFANAVTAVIKHAGVERAVVIGHSMGSPVGLKAMQDNPSVIHALVAVDGPIWKVKRTTTPPWLLEMKRDYRKSASGFIDSMFVDRTPLFLRAEIKRKMLLTEPHVGLSALMVMGNSDVFLKPAAAKPVLAIMAGRRPRDGRKQQHQEVFRNLRYDLWEEAGHFLMMEQPERFNRQVLEFLQTIPELHTGMQIENGSK